MASSNIKTNQNIVEITVRILTSWSYYFLFACCFCKMTLDLILWTAWFLWKIVSLKQIIVFQIFCQHFPIFKTKSNTTSNASSQNWSGSFSNSFVKKKNRYQFSDVFLGVKLNKPQMGGKWGESTITFFSFSSMSNLLIEHLKVSE